MVHTRRDGGVVVLLLFKKGTSSTSAIRHPPSTSTSTSLSSAWCPPTRQMRKGRIGVGSICRASGLWNLAGLVGCTRAPSQPNKGELLWACGMRMRFRQTLSGCLSGPRSVFDAMRCGRLYLLCRPGKLWRRREADCPLATFQSAGARLPLTRTLSTCTRRGDGSVQLCRRGGTGRVLEWLCSVSSVGCEAQQCCSCCDSVTGEKKEKERKEDGIRRNSNSIRRSRHWPISNRLSASIDAHPHSLTAGLG
ncbi:hypothetical protein QBC39DRAFT_89847 [Podospora conica]|nr:hypothetical protein QBC39DRAFT_89847 [Schizothecium conicum]